MYLAPQELYLDELGVFNCPSPEQILPGHSYASTLDGGVSRVAFWNPRAAWFATAYARLAQFGVSAMGASQFFGFDADAANQFGWLGPEGQCSSSGSYCGYPCLSSLNWDDATPNPRYHVLKLLIDQMRGAAMKHVYSSSVCGPPAPAPPAPSPLRKDCKSVGPIERHQDFQGGDVCQFNLTSVLPGQTPAQTCATACCANARCERYVVVAPSSTWVSSNGYCPGKPKCYQGGVCCFLKDAATEPAPTARTGYVRGSVSTAPPLPPPPAPAAPASLFTAVGFTFVSDGARRLIVVNGANDTCTVAIKWAGGATVSLIDAEHGHGLLAPARTSVPASTGGMLGLVLGPFAVAVLADER